MYKYIVVNDGTFEEYEGCWYFNTFKEAFDFVKERFNKEYKWWRKCGEKIFSNLDSEMDEKIYNRYANENDNGYVETLYFTIHNEPKNGVYDAGTTWEIYSAERKTDTDNFTSKEIEIVKDALVHLHSCDLSEYGDENIRNMESAMKKLGINFESVVD